MNPPCAFCKKTVYPTEKFNCLDKIWHKGCFKCTNCSLKLTMNTYKGFDKMPYCNAHYPKLKATSIASTAEQTRLKKMQDQTSQVRYHSDFNKAKGGKISVTDDPAMTTQRQASHNQSLAQYHGLPQKKADQELRRPAQEEQPEQDYRRGSGGGRGQQPPPSHGGGGYQQPPQLPPSGGGGYQQPPQLPPSGGGGYQQPPPSQPAYSYEPEPEAPQPDYDPEPQRPAETGGGGGDNQTQFKALYDYAAADSDEVSFQENDTLMGTIVDEGWIEGTVARTGEYGMAPRNYFEEE